jgi:UDP-N-acetylglucosamine 2-epimerase
MTEENRYCQAIDTLLELENTDLLCMMGIGLLNRKTEHELDENETTHINEALGEILCMMIAHRSPNKDENETDEIIERVQHLVANGTNAEIIYALLGVENLNKTDEHINEDVFTAYV